MAVVHLVIRHLGQWETSGGHHMTLFSHVGLVYVVFFIASWWSLMAINSQTVRVFQNQKLQNINKKWCLEPKSFQPNPGKVSPLVAKNNVCVFQSGVLVGSAMSFGFSAPRMETPAGTKNCSSISKMPAGNWKTWRTWRVGPPFHWYLAPPTLENRWGMWGNCWKLKALGPSDVLLTVYWSLFVGSFNPEKTTKQFDISTFLFTPNHPTTPSNLQWFPILFPTWLAFLSALRVHPSMASLPDLEWMTRSLQVSSKASFQVSELKIKQSGHGK